MPCYHPLKVWIKENQATGKKLLRFKEEAGAEPSKIPCGHCIGCRLERQREWAMRCHHEASLHDENSFITLTYDEQNLPQGQTLIKKHLQLFMKRLRKKISPVKIKFFGCGEYGEKGDRPHYHILIFGYDFPDKKAWKQQKDGTIRYFISEELNKLWKYGFSLIAPVTYETAAYVAGYVVKKIGGKLATMAVRIVQQVDYKTGEIYTHHLKAYERYNPLTMDIWEVAPEFQVMSRGGRNGKGIGHDWIQKYYMDMYPKDMVTINGKEQGSCKYYDSKMELINPEVLEKVKEKRQLYAEENQAEYTEKRLAQKEKCAKDRLERFTNRNLKERNDL